MSLRYRRYTNLNGHQVEFASELILPHERYFRRESKSQKAQIDSQSRPTTTPGKKKPFKDKI
ncbi:MAG: hypothetical protein A2Y23_15420 [Clostridiales bacterium GWB2_37_7]|nr:MAG: hypothetical protein A2Y23_15420 [Clostridiales bacterium GWB2_37_7]